MSPPTIEFIAGPPELSFAEEHALIDLRAGLWRARIKLSLTVLETVNDRETLEAVLNAFGVFDQRVKRAHVALRQTLANAKISF